MRRTEQTLQDIAHETYGADPAVEYAYAVTTIQSFSAVETAETNRNTLKRY